MTDLKDFDAETSVKALEAKFSQADQFAQHLINSLKKSKEADSEIKKIIRTLIREDAQCKSDIEDISKRVYKEKAVAFQKEFWWKVATIIIVPAFFMILGAALTHYFK